jgi:hypothetical protein
MQLNGTDFTDRHNRPSTLQKVGLRAYFTNNGEYFDPTEISGVTVFAATSNMSPSSVLDTSTGLISSSLDTDLVLMHFAPSAVESGGALAEDKYVPTDDASPSGVYRTDVGKYIVILDPATSGVYNFHGNSLKIKNGVSGVNDYTDVWTVKMFAGSTYQSMIDTFHLYSDTVIMTTQPFLVTASNKLTTKHVTLDSKVNLKVTTAITVENKDIDEATKNIFKDSSIVSGMYKIEKINEDAVSIPAKVEVSGYSDTSSLIDITSDNTMSMLFDSTQLATHASIADFGGVVGTYRLTAKYNLVNETIITKPFYFIVS